MKLVQNHQQTEQRLCCALRFFATGTYQAEVGDSEGVSQSTMHRIIARVFSVLSQKANDIITFSVDPSIMKRNSEKVLWLQRQ